VPKVSKRVYAQPDFSGFEHVINSTDSVTFSAKNPEGESVKLTATVRVVDFSQDASVAAKFFGSMESLVDEAELAVNAWLLNQAKAAARDAAFGLAEKIERAVQERIAAFTQKRGTAPNAEQVATIRARVVAAFSDDDL